MLEPSGNLLWRPQPSKLLGHDACQRPVLHQFADLGTKCTIPGGVVCFGGSIVRPTAIAFDLTAHCRWSSIEPCSDRANGSAFCHRAGDLLPLSQRQGALGAPP